jgi:hypothetical protein
MFVNGESDEALHSKEKGFDYMYFIDASGIHIGAISIQMTGEYIW